jgi:peptide/nickel transport system permease protein
LHEWSEVQLRRKAGGLMRYLMRRLFHAALLLAGASVLAFLFTALAPGNYFDEMRLNPQISSETLTALKAHYDLDKPLAVRYAVWLKSLAHGEMGYSFAYNAPVAPLLAVRARNTLLLTLTSTLLAWCIALPLGVWSAEQAGRWVDRVVTGTSATLLVIPDIALGLGLLMVAVHTRWSPAGGMVSVGNEGLPFATQLWDLIRHMVLPVTILVLGAQPVLVRHVRSAVGEALEEGFMRAAEAHGIRRRRLLWRYALGAAANPLISLFGFSIGALLSGSLLVEVITSWPGLGPFLLEAILARDLYVVIGGVLLSTAFLVAGNFIADLLLFWADPRIRTE